jgi:hypothetical protein
MTKRFIQAIRLLLGKPLHGPFIDGTMLLDKPEESEFDYTKQPPFDLAFPGRVALAPPVKIFCEDRFRVCVFPDVDGKCDGCGKPLSWLVLELRGTDRWYHLVTLYESRLAIMQSVLTDVATYLDAEANGSPFRSDRDEA